MGRFLSPDDGSDQSPGNPQSWNLYSYVRNNPLTNTDDDGNSVRVCDNNGQCNTVENDVYTASQQGNGGLNVPTLDQVGMNGDGNGNFNATAITDANGNQVGTATYVSDGATDYYANRNGYNLLGSASQTVKYATVGAAAMYTGAIFAPQIAGAGSAALATGRALYYAAAGLLPAVPSALEKLQKLGMSLSEANELLENPSTQRFVDNANGGNVNSFLDTGGKIIRITTDPNGQRIISAGIVQARNIANGIATGRFTK
jgi:uncharacterized protein RhaS with RHS repeats